jgi:hypothetical protein
MNSDPITLIGDTFQAGNLSGVHIVEWTYPATKWSEPLLTLGFVISAIAALFFVAAAGRWSVQGQHNAKTKSLWGSAGMSIFVMIM